MTSSSISDMRYVEHENGNLYRNYPFSETASTDDTNGNALACDVFVDASMYPVVSAPSGVRLLRIDAGANGVTVACDSGETLTGSESGGVIELYDQIGRHAGSIVCGRGWEREVKAGRDRSFDGLYFCPDTVCPIVYSGVVSMADGRRTWRTSRKNIYLHGDGSITPVLTMTPLGPELKIDAQYNARTDVRSTIREVTFAAVGDTLFDIAAVEDSTVELVATPLDREDVCWHAHGEDAVSVVVDACENQDRCAGKTASAKTTVVRVCTSEIGNVNLVSDDLVNYKNPIKISPAGGVPSQPAPKISADMSVDEMVSEAGKLLDRPVVVGSGIEISMPGVLHA